MAKFQSRSPCCTQSSMHRIWQIDLANNPLSEMMWQMFTPQQNECHTLPETVDIFTTIEFFNYLSTSTPRLSPRYQSNIYFEPHSRHTPNLGELINCSILHITKKILRIVTWRLCVWVIIPAGPESLYWEEVGDVNEEGEVEESWRWTASTVSAKCLARMKSGHYPILLALAIKDSRCKKVCIYKPTSCWCQLLFT